MSGGSGRNSESLEVRPAALPLALIENFLCTDTGERYFWLSCPMV